MEKGGKLLWSTQMVAHQLDTSPERVRKMVKEVALFPKPISPFKVGKRSFFKAQEIVDYVNNSKTTEEE